MRTNKTEGFKELNSLIYEDYYEVREYSSQYFDFIIDIGANIGQFSLLSTILWPNAQVYAVEPAHKTFTYLSENLRGLKNLKLINAALGNGDLLYLHKSHSSCSNCFYPQENKNTYAIQSVKLSDIIDTFTEVDIESVKFYNRYMLKIDCEGGEKYLMEKSQIPYIENADRVILEVHFRRREDKWEAHMLPEFYPTWKEYNDWIYDNFYMSHTIDYCKSSGASGYGHYMLRKKETTLK